MDVAMTVDATRLLALVAAGDEEAMRQLYLLFHDRVRRYLWHQLGGDSAVVEDALQDVFLAVWRTARGYRADAQVATWIFQIAHYRALHMRRGRSRFADVVPDETEAEAETTAEAAYLAASHEDAVLDRLALADALLRLSPKHREVLYLVSQQGFTLEEAARILAVPVGTVKSRMSYARQALLRALGTAGTRAGEDEHHDA
jgi:RNA polymerase sigma-70 factor (ECF subfamily)